MNRFPSRRPMQIRDTLPPVGSRRLAFLWRSLLLVLAIFALPFWGGALLLLLVTETPEARMVGLAMLTGLIGVLMGMGVPASRQPGTLLLNSVLFSLLSLSLVLEGYRRAPNGDVSPSASFQVLELVKPSFRRYSAANLIPEVDQIRAATFILPFVDRSFSSTEGKALRSGLDPIYEELERNAGFHSVGSSLHWAYRQLLGRSYDVGRCYLYLPSAHGQRALNGSSTQVKSGTNSGRRRGVLIFLHGKGGNLLAYPWILRDLAEQTGYAVLLPDFGVGDWGRPEALIALRRVLDHVDADDRLKTSHTILGGYGSGGLGVTALAEAAPGRFQALVYLAAPLDTARVRVLASPQMPEQKREMRGRAREPSSNSSDQAVGVPTDRPKDGLQEEGTQIWLLRGRDDARPEMSRAEAWVHELHAKNVRISDRMLEGDRWLLFTHRDAVIRALAELIEVLEGTAPGSGDEERGPNWPR